MIQNLLQKAEYKQMIHYMILHYDTNDTTLAGVDCCAVLNRVPPGHLELRLLPQACPLQVLPPTCLF